MNVIVISFVSLCVLVWLGHVLRMKIPLLQKLYLPSSVIAGLLWMIFATTLGMTRKTT